MGNPFIPPFAYSSLLRDGRHIRLIEIHPGKGQEEVRVNLRIANLENGPKYEALSYVWGDENNRLPLIHNDTRVEVTVNLLDALRRFRLPDKTRILWADALCINQEDLEEKSAQLLMMHRIYKLGERCLVWLGPEDQHTATAVKIIRDLSKIVSDRIKKPIEEHDDHLFINGRDIRQSMEIGFTGLPSADARDWASVFHLLGRQWFKRTWVIQEVYFAREVQFNIGGQILRYSELFHAADWCLTNSGYMNWPILTEMTEHYGRNNFYNIMEMRADDFLDKNQTLTKLLNWIKDFDATDLRDKVYGVMRLPPFQREYPNLIPNYKMSIQDLYADVAMKIMRVNKDLAVLSSVDHDLQSGGVPEAFASWVPRWDREDSEHGNKSSMWYNFGRASLGMSLPDPVADLVPGNILKLSGSQFDEVVDICEIECTGHRENPPWKPVFIAVEPWTPYNPSKNDPYSTEIESVVAYAMTLTVGCREERGNFSLLWPEDQFVQHIHGCIAWLQWLRRGNSGLHYPPGMYSREEPFLTDRSEEELEERSRRYHAMVATYTRGRRLFRTKRGYLGLGNHNPRKGDLVCIMAGGKIPLVLRKRRDGVNDYEYVGDAYVHGIMAGEGIVIMNQEGLEMQTFLLH